MKRSRRPCRRRAGVSFGLAALAALFCALGALSAARAAPAGGDAVEEPPRAVMGAVPPAAGKVVLFGEAGVIFLIPHVSAGLKIGTGGGASVELRYRNIAAFGHSGRAQLAWGTPIARNLFYGVAARTSITSLAQADGGVIGIEFSNLAIGNDWEIGSDMLLTWLRPGAAQITASLGPTWTLGGTRYTAFEESEFQIDPGWRSIGASVQGEWRLSDRFNVYLRLDATVLLGTEIQPIGYIPTGTVGLGWPL